MCIRDRYGERLTSPSLRITGAKTRLTVYIVLRGLGPSGFASSKNWYWSEVGGVNRSGADDAHRETKPSAHAPAPHARHDRSMARSSSVARVCFEDVSSVVCRRVQRPNGFNSTVCSRTLPTVEFQALSVSHFFTRIS